MRKPSPRTPTTPPPTPGLSADFLLLREYSTLPVEEAYRRAHVAAERAVSLDPSLPEAHACLGFIDFFDGWNAGAAEAEFQLALHLDPNSAIAHHWYGSMLTHQARFPEALDQLNAAQRLQPTSPAILASKAYALGLGGHRDEADALLWALIRAGDTAAAPHRILALLSLSSPSDVPLYLREMQRFDQMRNRREELASLAIVNDAYLRAGEDGMWSEILRTQQSARLTTHAPTFLEAEAEAELGRSDDALRDLSALARKHDPLIMGIAIDPAFHRLHADPRFQQTEVNVGIGSVPVTEANTGTRPVFPRGPSSHGLF